MIRRIAGERWYRKQRHDGRIKLMGPDVPIRELTVLARDERIEQRNGDQRVNACCPGRVLDQPVFEHPFVRVNVRPPIESFRGLPIESALVSSKGSRRAREVPNALGFSYHLLRITSGGGRRPEFRRGTKQQRLPNSSGRIGWICSQPKALARRNRSCPRNVGPVLQGQRNDFSCHLPPEFHTGREIGRKRKSGVDL